MTLRGVLWDMDGVLVDTGELHFQTWSQALARYNVPFSREAFEATFGMNNTAVLVTLLGRTPAPEWVAEVGGYKERLFREAVRGRVQPLPGVRAWVERLRAAGVRQAVASSAPPANIDALIDELDLRRYFEVLVAGDSLPAKPDPAIFLEAARLIDAPPAGCVVVEDSVAGVECAARAGMKCIAVTTTHPAQALRAADVVVERLDALPEDAFERLFA